MDEWFCRIAGRELGPMSSNQLKAMAAKGEILSTDTVRRGSTGKWILASRVRGLMPPVQESSPAAVEPLNAEASAEPPSFFGSMPPPKFFASPQPSSFGDVNEPTVSRPTETPSAPRAASPSEDQAPNPAVKQPAAPFDIFGEPVEPVPVSGAKSLAQRAQARRKRRQRVLMASLMLIVACGLTLAYLLLATDNLKDFGAVRDRGGLGGLSKKLSEAANKSAEEVDQDTEPFGVDNGLGASPQSKKSEEADSTADSAVLEMGIGNFKVHVASLIPATDPKGTPESRRLLIILDVKNLSGIEEFDFAPWSRAPGQAGVTLNDDQGRSYQGKPVDAAVVLRKRLPTSIEPGKSVKDVLAFDLPESTVRFLELEVSGAAFGVEASAKFKMPAKMIAEKPMILKILAPPDAKVEAAKKKQQKAKPGTPAGDFGLFDEEDEPVK